MVDPEHLTVDHRAGDHAGGLPGRRVAAVRRAEHGAVGQDPQRVEGGDGRQLRAAPGRGGHRQDGRAGPPGSPARRRLLRLRRGRQAHRPVAGPGRALPAQGDPSKVDLHELEERMLVIEAVESARCVEEGVIVETADANIGSIMGIGFPPWTGGVLQYINGFPGGVAAFVARADDSRRSTGRGSSRTRCCARRPRTASASDGRSARRSAAREAGPGRGRVLELPAIGPVPFLGMLLADLGAEVIRIDKLAGDGPAGRRVGRRPDGPRPPLDRPRPAQARRRRGRAAPRRACDVLVEGFRPGSPSGSASARTTCWPATRRSSTAG